MDRYSIVPVNVVQDIQTHQFGGRGGGRGGGGGRGRGGGGFLQRISQPFRRRQQQQQQQQQDDGGDGGGDYSHQPIDDYELQPEPERDRQQQRQRGGGRRFGFPEAAGAWPDGWMQHHRAVKCGGTMAVVAAPRSGVKAVSLPLEKGLYLVGEVPEEMLLGGTDDDFGILFLAPMLVKAAQKRLAQNRVDTQHKPGRGFRLFDEDDVDDDMAGELGDESRSYRRPRWFSRDEANEWGFGG